MSVQSETELRPYLIPAMNFISLAKVPKSQSRCEGLSLWWSPRPSPTLDIVKVPWGPLGCGWSVERSSQWHSSQHFRQEAQVSPDSWNVSWCACHLLSLISCFEFLQRFRKMPGVRGCLKSSEPSKPSEDLDRFKRARKIDSKLEMFPAVTCGTPGFITFLSFCRHGWGMVKEHPIAIWTVWIRGCLMQKMFKRIESSLWWLADDLMNCQERWKAPGHDGLPWHHDYWERHL